MGRFAGRLAPLPALLLLLAPVGIGGDAAAAPAPSCAEGPVRVGDTIHGTGCDDTIVVPASVTRVDGGAGADTIVPGQIVAAAESCPVECRLKVGSQVFEGGPGPDVVFGERGNDILRGGGGDDQLFGGIGDDLLLGGPGNDRLSGGFGADSIDGEEGDDYVRGDGTIDTILDTGGGADTLSFATGITPGFPDASEKKPYPDFSLIDGLPAAGGERGVYLNLAVGGENADDGEASLGGGVDKIEGQSFETVIGTPFSDYIVGTAAAQRVFGGGGADVIRGGTGADELHGGADGDFLEAAAGASADGEAGADNCPGAAAKTSCPGTATAVAARNTGAVSVGISAPGATGTTQLYLVGSSADDVVAVTYSAASVEFQLSSGQFDQSAEDEGGCAVTMTVATCPLTGPLDSIVLAGMGADDGITASGFPSTAGVVVTGGQGNDTITGGDLSEDVLADGPGSGDDDLSGLDRDDALLHNGGPDRLFGGAGNDLFLSVSICDQEALSGEAGRDNSSWARLGAEGVSAQLDPGRAGEVGVGGTPACPANAFDSLQGIEDLEGSNQPDVFFGDAERNQLLGHKGADSYFAGAGDDSILANSADDDTAIDCGDGVDSALIDLRPQFNDPVPVNCESVREAEPNNFRTVTELPPPPLPEPPPADLTPPRTRITHRPPKLVIARDLPRRVSFRFASSEPGSSFRCKLDRRPFGVCTPPRVFNLGRGRHAVRIFAVDAAGNRDPSPALFRFEVRRAKPASARG